MATMPRSLVRRLSAVSLALLTALALQTPARAAEPSDELTPAMAFRAAFGLATDVNTVRAIVADAGADRTAFGVALTRDEVAALEARLAVQAKLDDLRAYGLRDDQKATWGGGYIDQANGGVLYLGFTDDPARHANDISQLAPDDIDIRTRQVAHSEVQLDELIAQVGSDLSRFDRLGVRLTSVGKDLVNNRVEIAITPLTDDAAGALRAAFGADRVAVIQGRPAQLTACSSRDNCIGPPLRGGISTTYGCTVGFMIFEDARYRWLTAGHCTYQNTNWYHSPNFYSIGTTRDHSWYDLSQADAGSVGNISAAYMSNRVYYTASSWFGMYSAQGYNGDWEGQAICQSGRRSGYQCGTITDTNITVPYCDDNGQNCVRMTQQRQANYFIQVGDSGAPVINRNNTNQAIGVQSGMDAPNIAYFSHIYWAMAKLKAQLWTQDG